MTPRRYGPLAYVPITRRPLLTWPDSARVALWVNPNIEFFGLDDVMPGNQNERVPRNRAQIPNVRNWAVRDYGNRVGIWRGIVKLNSVESTFLAPLSLEGGSPTGVPKTSLHRTAAPPTAGGYHPCLS